MVATARTISVETVQAPKMVPVALEAPVCGECRYHMPRATDPGSWCTLPAAKLSAQPVTAGQTACDDFATWPEGSPVPAFLVAMGF